MKAVLTTLLSLSVIATAAAQGHSNVLDLIRRDTTVLLQADAPARWSSEYAATRLGGFFSSPMFQDLISPLRAELQENLDELRREAPPEAAELLDAMLAFDGRLTLAVDVWFDDGDPRFIAVLGMSGGADQDLEALGEAGVRAFEEQVAEDGETVFEQTFGDDILRLVELDPDEDRLFMSLPTRFGDDLALLLWSGERETIERIAMLDPAERCDADGLAGSLSLRISVSRLMDALLDQAEMELGPLPFDLRSIVERLGAAAVQTVELQVTPADEHVATDMRITWEGDGGILEMLVPERQGRARLFDITPTQTAAWTVGAMRVDRLYDMVADIWDAVAEVAPITRHDAEREIADALGVRLREDLIDHLGGEYLQVADESSFDFDFSEDADEASGLGMQAYALELRDAQAFGQGLEKALRARGLQAARKTTDYRDFELHRLRVAGLFQVDYAVTDRVFVFAINSRDPTHLRAILDEEAARRAGEPVAPMPEGVSSRLQRMPDGWHGASILDISVMSGALRAAIQAGYEAQGIYELPDEPRQVLDGMVRVEAALREQDLSQMVSVTWARSGELRQRLLW